jgi:hypothetical protein
MSQIAERDFVLRALEKLGREIGVGVVDGNLIFPFDDFFECVLTPSHEGARVVMEAPLLIVPESRRNAIFRKAMRLNIDPALVADGALYLDRETSALVLRAEAHVGAESGDGLSRRAAGFIEAARHVLEEVASNDGAASERSEADPAPVGFLKV